jgi:5-(carboxyamino)imidazole ribonucleotide synthase
MTVGVVGGGQLGRMLALAGYPLGLDFLFLDPAADAPAGQLAPLLQGSFSDQALLQRLARSCEVLTFDWENVSPEPLSALSSAGIEVPICPPVPALAAAQDRLSEKELFTLLSIPTTRWQAVGSCSDLERAVREIGVPGVLKTRRLGYDGKGQALIRAADELAGAWQRLGAVPLLYEEWIEHDCEVSIIGARGAAGETAVYPLSGNVHAQGILRFTRAPFGHQEWQEVAAEYLKRVLAHFDYRGVLTIEFFVRSGQLVANEMAPRVHNSGHWTIEGAVTSQFENHLRAILGLPLGSTCALGHAAMVNLIGEMPQKRTVLVQEGVHLHDYGKQPRMGRKVGHCTLVAVTPEERDARAWRLLREVAPEFSFP